MDNDYTRYLSTRVPDAGFDFFCVQARLHARRSRIIRHGTLGIAIRQTWPIFAYCALPYFYFVRVTVVHHCCFVRLLSNATSNREKDKKLSADQTALSQLEKDLAAKEAERREVCRNRKRPVFVYGGKACNLFADLVANLHAGHGHVGEL